MAATYDRRPRGVALPEIHARANVTRRSRTDERLDDAVWLLSNGDSIASVERDLRWSYEAMDRAARRHMRFDVLSLLKKRRAEAAERSNS